MRKTLLGMAGAAALVVGIDARAGDASADAAELRAANSRPKTTMVRAERVASDQRTSSDAEPAKPCEPAGDVGSASGEPATREAERNASQEEFLRNVWTAP